MFIIMARTIFQLSFKFIKMCRQYTVKQYFRIFCSFVLFLSTYFVLIAYVTSNYVYIFRKKTRRLNDNIEMIGIIRLLFRR